jgi:hypothetical protein
MGVEYEFPVILGRDYAGVTQQVGPGPPASRRRNVSAPPFARLHASTTIRLSATGAAASRSPSLRTCSSTALPLHRC